MCCKKILSSFGLICNLIIVQASFATPVIFGDFEEEIYAINPAAETDDKKFLWSQYSPSGNAELAVSDSAAATSSKSLEVKLLDGQLYIQFYPHNGVEWEFMSEVLKNRLGLGWKQNYYNRMEFYIYVPKNVEVVDRDQYNLSIGTYVRSSTGDRTSAESGGHHFYHRFHIPYTGEWHKVVFDMHPHHDRGADGNKDEGNQEYPTGEAGFNYFDALTRFYVALKTDGSSSGVSTFRLDGFKLYRESRPENEEQVYSLAGVYAKAQNKLIVTWQRNKQENDVDHELRYAFQDIHTIGWDGVPTSQRVGPFDTKGYSGYNNVYWEKTGIDMGLNEHIYVAIKPVNSNLFKQIEIPLNLPMVDEALKEVKPTVPGDITFKTAPKP